MITQVNVKKRYNGYYIAYGYRDNSNFPAESDVYMVEGRHGRWQIRQMSDDKMQTLHIAETLKEVEYWVAMQEA